MKKQRKNTKKTTRNVGKHRKTGAKRGLSWRYLRRQVEEAPIPSGQSGNNPFGAYAPAPHPGPKYVLVNFPQICGYLGSEKFIEILEMEARRFAWFNDYEIEPRKHARRGLGFSTLPAVRRVLFSFLAGGTKKEMAARVPTSRSGIYKVIWNEIYRYPDLTRWLELGLIAVWDIPSVIVEPLSSGRFGAGTEAPPVVCLVCHYLAGFADIPHRKFDCSVVHHVDWIKGETIPAEQLLRGHIISHFQLGNQPAPNIWQPALMGTYSPRIEGRDLPRNWQREVGITTFVTARDFGSAFRPNVQGRVPTPHEVEKLYMDLLG